MAGSSATNFEHTALELRTRKTVPETSAKLVRHLKNARNNMPYNHYGYRNKIDKDYLVLKVPLKTFQHCKTARAS